MKLVSSRKGDISITTIIVAAIALIVLVVLILIFTGRMTLFGSQYDATGSSTQDRLCGKDGGRCIRANDPNNPCQNTKTPPQGGWIDCAATNMVCCQF